MYRNQYEEWIVNWMMKNGDASATHQHFHEEVHDAFPRLATKSTLWGAETVSVAMTTLAKLAKRGIVKRHRTGIQGMAGQGFPTWVFVYELAPWYRKELESSQTHHATISPPAK
jgi:hypothetical protein